MKLRINRGEIDEIIRMGKHRQKLAALDVIQKAPNFFASQRMGKPLHVVLHEHLDRRAFDRAAALDGRMNPATNRHVSAEENWFAIGDL